MADRFFPNKYIDHETAETTRCFTQLIDDRFNSIIVAVDCACRNNGRPDARASLSVFFQQGSKWNKANVLPTGDNTSQGAELCTALRALHTVRDLPAGEWPSITNARTLKRVIIKSDSQYLVSSMTKWIFKWLVNGFINAKGQSVVNRDLFKRLLHCIRYMSQEQGVEVQFWHVGREHNQNADALANAALDVPYGSSTAWDHSNPRRQRQRQSIMAACEQVWHLDAQKPLRVMQLFV